MNRNNKLRLIFISFLSYGLTGALIVVTGVVLNSISGYFRLPITDISNTFTFLNLGILLSIFLNIWLMQVFDIKKQLIFGFILMVLSILGLIEVHNLNLFSFLIFILGVVSGITMSIGTCIITYLYEGKERGSYLLFTDSFFSMSGIIFPIISSSMLSHQILWYWIYICIGIFYVIILILTLMSEFPEIKPYISHKLCKDRKILEINALIFAISALCYILGQLSFISWIPEYITSRFYLDIEKSGRLVGVFWLSYMIGMWVFSFLLRFFDLYHAVVFLTALSTAIMYIFININNPNFLSLCLFFLGFFSSAIYTTIITLGSQQTKQTSSKLVNFILVFGTIGTMLTFIVTSPIVLKYGVKSALKISNILYFIVFILCLLASFINKKFLNIKMN